MGFISLVFIYLILGVIAMVSFGLWRLLSNVFPNKSWLRYILFGLWLLGSFMLLKENPIIIPICWGIYFGCILLIWAIQKYIARRWEK